MKFGEAEMRWLMVGAALMAAPVMGQEARQAGGLAIEEAAEQRVWIDEHARWNAEHMAAARRLADIVDALKRHDSNFDRHGNVLRAHPQAMKGRDRASVAQAQARLRASHEEARSAHHHLMADVDALAAVMAEKFGLAPQ
jgi:hypothetical protein